MKNNTNVQVHVDNVHTILKENVNEIFSASKQTEQPLLTPKKEQ